MFGSPITKWFTTYFCVFVLQYLFGDVPRDLNHLMAAGSAQLFPRNKAKHPVTNFCGMTRDGLIAITETGKVCPGTNYSCTVFK